MKISLFGQITFQICLLVRCCVNLSTKEKEMRTRVYIGLAISLLLSVALVFGVQEEEILRLQLGDETLKTKTMAVSPGKIYAAKTGESVSFAQMIISRQWNFYEISFPGLNYLY